jgi:DNA-binding Lrp family transcriptional regulator
VEEIDRRIVSLLSRNGRMSFTELARQAGLSVSAVHQRVRRLETDGVITGYVALCDPQVIGLPLTAFVSIKPFDQSAGGPGGTAPANPHSRQRVHPHHRGAVHPLREPSARDLKTRKFTIIRE